MSPDEQIPEVTSSDYCTFIEPEVEEDTNEGRYLAFQYYPGNFEQLLSDPCIEGIMVKPPKNSDRRVIVTIKEGQKVILTEVVDDPTIFSSRREFVNLDSLLRRIDDITSSPVHGKLRIGNQKVELHLTLGKGGRFIEANEEA